MFKGLKKEIQDEYRQTLKHLVSGPLREEITDRSFAQTDIAGACGLGGGGSAGEMPEHPRCGDVPPSCSLSRPRCGPRAEGPQHSRAPLSRSRPCVGPQCQPSALGSSTLPHPRRR